MAYETGNSVWTRSWQGGWTEAEFSCRGNSQGTCFVKILSHGMAEHRQYIELFMRNPALKGSDKPGKKNKQ